MSRNWIVGGMVAGAWIAAGSVSADDAQGPLAVRCWGRNNTGQCDVPSDLGAAIAIAGGYSHTIALRADGTVFCWGDNYWGQSNVPADLGVAVAIAGGGQHSIALRADGTVRCWGNSSYGQCNVPVGVGAVVSIGGGWHHTIVLRADGLVSCWGYNDYGQCNVPPDVGAVVQIDAGGNHSIALRADGSIRCWGENNYGQCSVPPDLGVAAAVSGGGVHTIALLADGTVRCWGSNSRGQCNVPLGLEAVTAVAGGQDHTVALLPNGAIRVWGDNSHGQSSIPAGIGTVTAIAGGGDHTAVLFRAATINQRSGLAHGTIPQGILAAADGDTLVAAPWALASENVDYRGKSIELLSTDGIARGAGTTTIFADGARLAAPGSIAIDGSTSVPSGAGVSISSGAGLSIDGETFVSVGGSILAQNDGSPVTLEGELVLATDAVFSAFAPVELSGSLDLLGGVVVADTLSAGAGSQLVAVEGMIDAAVVSIGGSAASLGSAIIADVAIAAGAELAASGDVVGDVDNAGRLVTTDDLVVVGDVTNASTGLILAQVGVLYVTGDLVSDGLVVGDVVTAPGFMGGGTGGTEPGDGIRVAGSVSLGAEGGLRFIEDFWRFSVCGDVRLACPADHVRFNAARLSFDGCEGSAQHLEATSGDLGCDLARFGGEDSSISLFGELEIAPGTTLELRDDFDNAPGKGAEALYARGLHVAKGATLVTNGLRVYARNANVEGSIDDPANLCIVSELPDADVNDDGVVNAIDLAYVLSAWGTATAIADLDRSGVVDALDLAIVLNGWSA